MPFGALYLAPPMETELLRAYQRRLAGKPLSARMMRIAGRALETNTSVLASLGPSSPVSCVLARMLESAVGPPARLAPCCVSPTHV